MNILHISVNSVRICGGVARSNFFCNYLANLLGFQIQRSPSSFSSSSLGAAICAGIGNGIWIKKEEVQSHRKNVVFFEPLTKNRKQNSIQINNFKNSSNIQEDQDNLNFEKYFKNFERDIFKWNKAILRCKNWYADDDYL
jgi:glycerol kinase